MRETEALREDQARCLEDLDTVLPEVMLCFNYCFHKKYPKAPKPNQSASSNVDKVIVKFV